MESQSVLGHVGHDLMNVDYPDWPEPGRLRLYLSPVGPPAETALTSYVGVLLREGVALHQIGRLEDAREHQRRAIEIDPANGVAYYRLALVEQALSDPDAARMHFEKARALGFVPERP